MKRGSWEGVQIMSKVKVIGMGPGHRDYVLPIAETMINQATWLIGGKRHLEEYGSSQHKVLLPITANIDKLLCEIEDNYCKETIVVLVSGDPGLYSFTRVLLRRLPKDQLEVYPGISAMQYLFAKGAIQWEDAYLASFHGREEMDISNLCKTYKCVALFTDSQHGPNWVISQLAKHALLRNKKILIGENLSYDDERLTISSVSQWKNQNFERLNVMVIYDE